MAINLRKVFYNELRRESRAAREPLHRAFIKWYVRTRFGSDVKCEITDGPSDSGIDAIVTESRVKGRAISSAELAGEREGSGPLWIAEGTGRGSRRGGRNGGASALGPSRL